MAFTKRKENRLKAWDKYNSILKKYSRKPVIKNVDIEELKKQFSVAAPLEAEAKPKVAKKKAAEAEVVSEAPAAE
jgi:hypothetical protein